MNLLQEIFLPVSIYLRLAPGPDLIELFLGVAERYSKIIKLSYWLFEVT